MVAQVLSRSIFIKENEPLVARSIEEYTINFEFETCWEGYAKVAVFKAQDGTLKEVVIADNAANIPWEVLQQPGILYIGVYGTKTGRFRPTVWSDPQTVYDGAQEGDPATQAETTPWEEAVQQMGEDLEASQAILSEISSYMDHPPTIISDMWYFWDPDEEDYVSSGVQATGATPELSIGTVDTAAAGSPASVSITGTTSNPVLNFLLPYLNYIGVTVSNTTPDTDDVLWVNPSQSPDVFSFVKAVNNILPNSSGNVTLPEPFSVNANTFGESYDLNNVTKPGFYYYAYDANAHTPTAGGGAMIVMSSSNGTYATQLAFPYFGLEISPTRYYIRYKNPDNGWHSWVLMSGIIDALDSNNDAASLSAKQGKVLNDRLTAFEGTVTITNLNTLSGTGIYVYGSDSTGAPNTYAGAVFQIQSPNNQYYRLQIATVWSTYGTIYLYIRSGGPNATDYWSDWKQFTLSNIT